MGIQREEERSQEVRQVQTRSSDGLTPKQRVRRGIRAMMFVRRLELSMQETYTVHGMMLEVTEAVAKHWHDIWGYYCVFVVGTIGWVFFSMARLAALSGK